MRKTRYTMVQKVFRQMTATQILSAVTVTVCLLIDSIMIGRFLGVEAMSSYGLANPVLIIFNALGTMMACGIQIFLGRAMGRGDQKEMDRCYSTSIAMSVVMAAVWIIVIFAASKPICIMLGAGSPGPDNHVFSMTGEYLKGYILGAPFYFLSQIMVPYLQAMGKRKLTIYSVIAMTVCDIVFNSLSVFVFHGGMFGIGLASGLSYLASLLVCIGYFLSKDCVYKFDSKAVDFKATGDIIYGGNPIMLNQAFFMIRVYATNHILLSVSGTVAIAALSVLSTIGNILFSIGLGAGSISLMLASIFYNEEDRKSIHELISVMVRFSFRLIVIVVILVNLAAPQIIGLFFSGSAEVMEMAVTGFRYYSVSLISSVVMTVFKNYYQGTKHMRFANMISLFDNVIIIIPIIWIFSKLMGLDGVWLGILIAQTATLLFISIVVWYRYGKVSLSIDAYSMLGPDFGAAKENVYEATITDMTSAIEASRKIREFCMEKGLGDRLSMLLSLCVEEIVTNIVYFGFNSDNKEHNAEVRLVIDVDKCIVRVRDNCIGFDPTHYFELHKGDDLSAHIGIRMVMAMVNEVDYINSLGLNNLYMSINR